MASRLVVMAHFDVDGQIAPHVRRLVSAWTGVADQLVVVTTARLTSDARQFLTDHAELIVRSNVGYDFLSYQTGLNEGGDLAGFDEVVICNDSFVGPLRPYAHIFDQMASCPVDFWGLTQSRRISPHVQSFFAVFRSWLVRSAAFTRFWAGVTALSDRKQVIHRYEVGMSAAFLEAGFALGSYFSESPADELRARQRMRWWAAHRPPGIRLRRSPEGGVRVLPRQAREPWNPGIALADRALPDGRLPMVKIDTLRFDPYGLGSDRLLAACEHRFPVEFGGVREYLDRTATRYPRRGQEELLRTPLPLRPLSGAVGYRG